MIRSFIISFILLPVFVFATQYAPWFGKDLELDFRPSYSFQYYSHIHIGNHNVSQHAYNHFFNNSLSSTYDIYSTEIELNLAKTQDHAFEFNDVILTGRYLFLSDVAAEAPISLSGGISFIFPTRYSLNDLNVMHHGLYESEVHLAAGKESSCGAFWTTHLWGVAAVGIAERGAPWVRANFTWEKNACDLHRYRLFINTLWGLGRRGLSLDVPFTGYGSIRHQSVDIGIGYSHFLECFDGSLDIQFAQRVFAYNYPAYASTLTFELFIPFGF